MSPDKAHVWAVSMALVMDAGVGSLALVLDALMTQVNAILTFFAVDATIAHRAGPDMIDFVLGALGAHL